MTVGQPPSGSGGRGTVGGINGLSRRLRDRLCQYLEAQIPLRNDSLVAERRALMLEDGALTREPYLETTPSYALGRPYQELDIPRVIASTLSELADWSPGVGVFERPFGHQAAALEAFFRAGRDLVVASGTGSGKTETFLLPIFGTLTQEAAERPASFARPGCRALLLYPMNALVQDQLVRLRRLFGNERVGRLFEERYGRPPRFGTYTSRTPYAGQRTGDRDRERVDAILNYYLSLEGPTASAAERAIARELRDRGRWPAKDLEAFRGTPGTSWGRRLQTSPHDRELLTRHEMQTTCPDVLVTNYSMLEYMLMRPIERSIFEQTQSWLAADSANTFLLVLDEAHVYRGASGAEVALLIRRLQARLGIPRDRVRCILTSASLGESDRAEQAVLAFAEGLTGRPAAGPRFQLIRGAREATLSRRPGTPHEAEVLATLSLAAFDNLEQAPSVAWEAARQCLGQLGLAPLAALGTELTAYVLREHLAVRLAGFGPLHELIALTTGHATAFSELPQQLFPAAPLSTARAATEALLALGSTASRGGRPLLATRAHLIFRGLPPIFACIDPDCTQRRDQEARPSYLLGRLYATPRAACDCARRARVYEIATHRDCGAAFLRVYGQGVDAGFYWHEAGGRLFEEQPPLTEAFLLLEEPHPRQASSVTPLWLEMATGRAVAQRPPDPAGFRLMYRVHRPRGGERGANAAQDEDPDDPGGSIPCPACTRRTSFERFGSLETLGERPFANLVREQLQAQPPSRRANHQYPNAGRKILLFSDGRQRAARLARDLPREVEHDVFRQALVLAAHLRGDARRGVRLDSKFYTAFVAACARHRLHFFDNDDQVRLLGQIRQFQQDYDDDLQLALEEDWEPSQIERYRAGLLRLVSDPYFAIDRIGVGVTAPTLAEGRRLRRQLEESLPPVFLDRYLEPLTRAWIQIMLRRAAFDLGISRDDRLDVREYYRPVPHGHRFRVITRLSREWAQLDAGQEELLLDALYGRFTESTPNEGGAHLSPPSLMLQVALDDVWMRCQVCNEIQHPGLPPLCLRCGERRFEERPPDDPATRARLDYFRAPIRAVLQGERPFHITAEEHTAQLSYRDDSSPQTTTEAYELRFQDVWLGPDRPPIDILSCTTTMEVGVDIGSLIGVGLRNVPPRRENYQQRAGRAGRRGTALSSVLTYAQSGPHDGYYFSRPDEIVAGDPREPMVAVDNARLARRHVSAYLLQHFFLEHVQRLSAAQQQALEADRVHLFSALGETDAFFRNDPDNLFTLAQLRHWLQEQLFRPDAPHARAIGSWLPAELAHPDQHGVLRTGAKARRQFAIDAGRQLLSQLDQLSQERPASGVPGGQDEGLLRTLFDGGLLPTYAFPVDLSSFAVFGMRDGRPRIVEKPQQQKGIALSEYAPGRQLVIDKKTYRVGGIFVEADRSGTPGAALFAHDLEPYVGCETCNYVRLGTPPGELDGCPVCGSALVRADLLDPPGFAPEGGDKIPDRDREQAVSYATSARLPTPIGFDRLDWRHVTHALRIARAPEQELLTVNAGPDSRGFVVCESCAAAWPAGNEPDSQSNGHLRPFPLDWVRSRRLTGRCRGNLRRSLHLGYTFRTDLLVARLTLQSPMDTRFSPWLLDACQSLAEALALSATRVLDIDPMELQPGFRLLPSAAGAPGTATIDLFLYDTADGGAGYAAEAGARIEPILAAAMDLATQCERGCRQSCTSCLRHYGNRFLQSRLDRHLAASLLRYLLDGKAPAPLALHDQAALLEPAARYLELEGHLVQRAAEVDGITAPLQVRRSAKASQAVVVGVQPALLDDAPAQAAHGLADWASSKQFRLELVRDYALLRDLPSVCSLISASLPHS